DLRKSYPKYFGSDKPLPMNTNYNNNLLLFHGKTHNMFLSENIDYKSSYTYLVDYDRTTEPDFNENLAVIKRFEKIPNASIDNIVIYYCYCHTKNVLESNINLIEEF